MKLPNGETCRKCKPDVGACDKHLRLDPCYQANVVKPKAVKPSPLPWTQDDGLISAANGVEVADFEIVKADAALIVRAVNAHAGLVKAADRALTMMREDGEECCCHGTPDAIYEPGELCPMCDLKAALRAAGEAP